jgi:dephospho-CoA kinase
MYITDHTGVALLIGLTGNIACGKTTVGHLLADRFGADYVDADRLVHALYAPGTPETRAIAARSCSPTAPSTADAWATW